MRWIRWFAAAFGVFTIAVIGVVVFLVTLDLETYRDDIRGAFREATGRDIEIDGRLHLTLTPRPAVSVSGVRMSNAEWGSAPAMVTVGELDLGVEVMPLLSGRLDVRRLGLHDVTVLLERDADGAGNWQVGTGSGAASGRQNVPVLRDIEIERVSVVWKEEPGAAERTYRIDRLTLAGDGAASPLAFELAADLDGDAVALSGTLPPPSEILRSGAALPVDIAGTVAGTTVALAADLRALDGNFRRFRADRVEASWGDLAGRGVATLDLTGTRPRIEATVDLQSVELAGPEKSGPRGGDPLDRPFPIDRLSAVDGIVHLTVGRLTFDDLVAEDVRLTATLEASDLRLDPVTALVAGGLIEGRASMDASRRPARLAIAGDGIGIDMATLHRRSGRDAPIEGSGDVTLDLRGDGDTGRAVIVSLGGMARLLVRNGTMRSRTWELIAADLSTRFIPFIGQGADDEQGNLNCLVARFDVTRGTADATVLLVDTKRVTVGGAGTVDLARQALDLRLVPRPKDPSLISLATPILLTGPIESPVATPDPIAVANWVGQIAAGAALGPIGLLLPFLSAGSVDDPCPDAIAVARGERPTTTAAPAGSTNPGGIGGLFENLRRAID